MTMDRETRMRRIRETICDIPPGCVASYGQVAEIAGIPRVCAPGRLHIAPPAEGA